MTAVKLQSAVVTPDGKVFSTAAEARDYLRAPLVAAALKRVAGGDASLSGFLAENEDEIKAALDAGVIARVTKSQRNKLTKAVEHMLTITDNKLKFLQDNSAAVIESFRWPSVKRMSPEEKTAATLAALTLLADANAAAWIVANQAIILEAYEAGVEKRMPNPKAMEALAKARAVRTAASEAKKAEEAAKTAE